jgi:prepilin-type N-terminal cleavage/methylation domain-containing protein
MKPHSKDQAFTLIELLVVIAILGMLVSLAIPSLSRARISSIQAKGLSNLKQLYVMVMSYCADNNGRIPLGGGTVADNRNALSWINRLLAYAGHPELAETNLNDWWDRPPSLVFKDPGIGLPGEMDRIRATTPDAIWGFGYNVQPLLPENPLFLADWQEQPLDGITLSAIPRPSKRILFASAYDWHIAGSGPKRAYDRYGKDRALGVFFDGRATVLSRAEYENAYQSP